MKHSLSILVAFVCLLAPGSLIGRQSSPAGGQAEGGIGNGAPSADPATQAAATAMGTSSLEQTVVPRLIKFNGVLHDLSGKPLSGPVDVTFSLYAGEAGGTALWFETQTVQADSLGKSHAGNRQTCGKERGKEEVETSIPPSFCAGEQHSPAPWR